MLKITVSEDCGNAPKKLLLRDFNIAFAKNDVDTLLQHSVDDIRWDKVGDGVIEGKAAMADALAQMQSPKATELTLANIITHGNTGAVDGTLQLEDGSRYAFCDIYRFSNHGKNAKVKTITSYVIAI